jgi:hypothetical protein
MRGFMKGSLFALFLIGLSVCGLSALLFCQNVAHEPGWKRGRLPASLSSHLDPSTLRYTAVWGALVAVLAPISFAALDAVGVKRRRPLRHRGLSEPNIDQIYAQRQIGASGDHSSWRTNGQSAESGAASDRRRRRTAPPQ